MKCLFLYLIITVIFIKFDFLIIICRQPMDKSNIVQENVLDLQFGYDFYHDFSPKLGWLLSFDIVKNKYDSLEATLYFVDEFSNNFKIQLSFFPSIIIECKDDLNSVEEYLRKRYEGQLHSIEIIEKIDVKEYNHLHKPPKKFLKIYFRTEISYHQCTKNLKDIILEGSKNRYKNEVYSDFYQEEHKEDITDEIIQIHEYDIPYEILVGNQFNIRCGCWYNVEYDGEEYKIVPFTEKIAYPDLRIFAFDIETTKPPLKFPNADIDQIMMISIMTEEFGELITNRQLISEDIQEFEYHAKDDMKSTFRIFNEINEEALLIRFLEVILEHRPHIITTYNGSFFDWPFITKRLKKYNIDIYNSIQFQEINEYFECPFIVHLDCYKWVKRDSYLPMNNQGLKDVARIKLGYFPDEIDPEDMVRYASEDPQKLASYSVSDAIATYYLYIKYVQSHIFSVCSLIPLPPVHILCKGAGTLCESLLLAESISYNILVPLKKKTSELEYYKGHLVENLTYVGGHVESLKAGIFRSDFDHDFLIDDQMIELIVDNIDQILEDYTGHIDYEATKNDYINTIRSHIGKINSKGCIYHLDVGAMYPNIILTNRLQPFAVVNDDICVRCDFNDIKNQCRKKMEWISRVEYIPAESNEINMIKNQLENETFIVYNNDKPVRVPYKDLPDSRKDSILKDKVIEYSKMIYKRSKKTEENKEDIYICQREIPFYVETVRKFRDQRYVYKNLYKKACQEYEKNPTNENMKNMTVYSSLQVAYKCILNSFYGYVMREGSRWFSLEMAATVCNVGGQIIKLAKELIERIGIPLELDTDGIWGILPAVIPQTITLGGKSIPILSLILNYFVCKKFTNYQYQILDKDGNFNILPQNSIFFELDGPYKTMIIPSSTEENKLLKKRYVVFDYNNKIVELKGFELKRRGELNFIKKFQEDIFARFNDGSNLKECYKSLADTCNYWLEIIDGHGGPLDDESIFYLFSESRSMSKNVDSYANKKSNILSTAKRLSEFLGNEVLEEKLKCEFIVSKFPPGAPVADRVIPVMIFQSAEKELYLKKWLKSSTVPQLRNIIDWEYYRERFESILQRIIVIPAFLQNIENPVLTVPLPSWIKDISKNEKLSFKKINDIEDSVITKSLSGMFYSKDNIKRLKNDSVIVQEIVEPVPEKPTTNISLESQLNLKTANISDFISKNTGYWIDYYNFKTSLIFTTIKFDILNSKNIIFHFLNGKTETEALKHNLFIDVANKTYFSAYPIVKMYLPDHNQSKGLVKLEVDPNEIQSEKYLKFLNHFSIGKAYNNFNSNFQVLNRHNFSCGDVECVIISSFNYSKKPVFVITYKETYIVSENKHPSVIKGTLTDLISSKLINQKLVVFNKNDQNRSVILETFKDMYHLGLDVIPSKFLENFDNLIEIHKNLNLELKIKFKQYLSISKFTKIPLLNISENILDQMLYKYFFDNSIMPVYDPDFSPRIVRDEMHKSGFYNTYCIQFESTNTLLLSILEYKESASDISLYHGYQRKDFLALKNFLKNLMLNGLKGNEGLKSLFLKIPYWIKKGSEIIHNDLREVIEATHQHYSIGLISAFKQNQIKVISSSKDLIIVDTEKTSIEGCNAFIEYVKKKISSIPGYELLNLKPFRIFQKFALIDQTNYFYLENNGVISGFSEYKIPLIFLNRYFSDNEINNDEIYTLVKSIDRSTLKTILRMLSYKRDIHGLASNCYRLMRCSGFEDDPVDVEFNLTIFCKNCGFENFLRKKCIKCYSDIDRVSAEKECVEYLKYCWKMQQFGSRYCTNCNAYEDRKLKEYCCCGGKYIRKEYYKEIDQIQKFISSKIFDSEVEKFVKFFK